MDLWSSRCGQVDHGTSPSGRCSATPAELRFLNGPIDSPEQLDLYRAPLGETPLTYLRLTASADALTDRVRARAHGQSAARLAGDDLVGLSEANAEALAGQALRAQVHADHTFPSRTLYTTGVSVEDAGRRILAELMGDQEGS